MKVFKKVLKNKLFYLVLLLGVFFIPIFKFNLQAQEDEYVDYSNKNLVSLDLENKEYLGNGVYRLYNGNGITIDYNVLNGEYVINGTTTRAFSYIIIGDIFEQNDYVLTFYKINGSKEGGNVQISLYSTTGNPIHSPTIIISDTSSNLITDISNYTVYGDMRRLNFYTVANVTYNNYTFRVQLEKGDTATPYTVPLQPYLWHEKQLSYDDGYDDGFRDGEVLGYDDGYWNGQFDYGIYINDEWVNATDYGELQYNEARAEYGIFINDEWISAVDYGGIQYNEGYQDGEGDTHDYYNDNGLFIPQLTPKAHLVVDYDQRYGEPYFYLQDFSGNYDPEYFGFQHNQWLEKAFNWAYSVESDFLAINDLYTIKYESDEVIYKYFFYKYDTDSIYFYNDNGTLLKIVDRVDFDYYIYDVPELSQEEQARIDNAYTRGMWDYGYYDAQSEKYLTATEYGAIQYNKGVISTRDKAYSDGFFTALYYSHKHGYNWVGATYYELIAERPILLNVTDLTSFAYGEGYNEGFDDGEYVGYNKGYDVGLDDGYDDGLLDGFDDGYEVGYWKGYDIAVEDTPEVIYNKIYNKGYSDGQKTGMNNKFYTGLEKWIVPAIIVVLFFGLLMLFPKNKEN